MAINRDLIKARLTERGPDGKLLSVLTGDETDAELRELAVHFTQTCPANRQNPACPFRSLNHFYHVTLKSLLDGMTHKSLVSLFDLECEVRNGDAESSCLQDAGKHAIDFGQDNKI